jgi:hypothetical protein
MQDVETIGQALAGGWTLIVRCGWGKRLGMKSIRECVASAELDLKTLVWTRGHDFPIIALGDRKLRCPVCRSLRVRLLLSPPKSRPPAAAPNPWRRAS